MLYSGNKTIRSILRLDRRGRHHTNYTNTFRTTPRDTSRATYIDALKFQVEILQRELEDRKEEARRYQHLLAAALERIPALEEAQPEATREPRESPDNPSDVVYSTPNTTRRHRAGEAILGEA